jgi:hypothetical protein
MNNQVISGQSLSVLVAKKDLKFTALVFYHDYLNFY